MLHIYLGEQLTRSVHYHGNRTETISNPAEFPDVTDPKSRVIRVEEPMGELTSMPRYAYGKADMVVNATIFVPQSKPIFSLKKATEPS